MQTYLPPHKRISRPGTSNADPFNTFSTRRFGNQSQATSGSDRKPRPLHVRGEFDLTTPNSFGAVLWTVVNDALHMITQVSVSAVKGDMKFDPFRGRMAETETKWACVTRKLWDESCHLIDLRSTVQQEEVDQLHPCLKTGLFHIFIEDSSFLETFFQDYHGNLRYRVQNPDVEGEMLPCFGVAAVSFSQKKRLNSTAGHIRIASQLKELTKESSPSHVVKISTLVREEHSNGTFVYRAKKQEEIRSPAAYPSLSECINDRHSSSIRKQKIFCSTFVQCPEVQRSLVEIVKEYDDLEYGRIGKVMTDSEKKRKMLDLVAKIKALILDFKFNTETSNDPEGFGNDDFVRKLESVRLVD